MPLIKLCVSKQIRKPKAKYSRIYEFCLPVSRCPSQRLCFCVCAHAHSHSHCVLRLKIGNLNFTCVKRQFTCATQIFRNQIRKPNESFAGTRTTHTPTPNHITITNEMRCQTKTSRKCKTLFKQTLVIFKCPVKCSFLRQYQRLLEIKRTESTIDTQKEVERQDQMHIAYEMHFVCRLFACTHSHKFPL